MYYKNTLFVGKVLHNFDKLRSTNEYAISILSKSKPIEGTVISTHFQTAGKGQIGSQWLVAPGKNITLSVILYPNFLPVPQQFSLSQAVSLAVVDFIRHFVSPALVKLKWPNDIYIGDKKSTGILIQNTIAGTRLQSSVIGLGINVNQVNFPAALPNPTSIALESGKDNYVLDDLKKLLFSCLEARYLQLKAQQWDRISTDYHASLYRLNEIHPFQSANGQIFSGKITGVTKQGLLKITTGGEALTFNMKEVTFAKH